MEYHCQVDYTNDIFLEQAYYASDNSHVIDCDFEELGIIISNGENVISDDGNFIYPERVFYPTESLIRDYVLTINEDILTLKSNSKVLLKTDINNIGENIELGADLQSYTSSYLLVDFHFYNPNAMKNKMSLQVYFGDDEMTRDFVARSWLPNSNSYLSCQNEIEETSFIEYQKYWVSLYEKISKTKAKYTNGK